MPKESKSVTPPTVRQMELFAKKFKQKEWEKLTSDQEFLNTFCFDLKVAKELAEKLLK